MRKRLKTFMLAAILASSMSGPATAQPSNTPQEAAGGKNPGCLVSLWNHRRDLDPTELVDALVNERKLAGLRMFAAYQFMERPEYVGIAKEVLAGLTCR